VHVKYGLVLGEDGKKFSTREGNAVPLQEVIDKIVKLAAETVKQKNPELPEEKVGEISHAVGVGALKYNDLKQHPHSDIVFDWKAMLDLSGNSGPYLQYTYARLVSILAKAGTTEVQLPVASYQLLASSEERALMRHLLDFGDVVEKCAEHYALSGLALYLYELANGANRFYEAHRILDDENNERKGARLILIRTVSEVLNRGLGLLGIRSLERI
jgi:arginyl-tRNA synthetase